MLPTGQGPQDLYISGSGPLVNDLSSNQSPTVQPSANNSPAPSTSSKRKATQRDEEGGGPTKKKKGKGKGKEQDEGEDELSDEEGKGRKKRNRMALSCKECKRRKIKCDRTMPVCGHCSKRGRPTDCSWDILDPGNVDTFLPSTIARTSELEQLAERLAHVEAYLKTLPPNFALFRPLVPQVNASTTPGDSNAKDVAPKAEKEVEDGYSDTEDAAVTLENGVFNGRLALDPTAKVPTSVPPSSNSTRPFMAHAPVSFPGTARPPQRFGAPVELTSALTSIVSNMTPASSFFTSTSLRAHLNLEFEASPASAYEVFVNEVDRMIRSLPGREATTYLVDRYFTSVAWLFRVVHAPSFRAEVEAFHKLCDEGRQAEVDIYWLSLLFMVLSLAVDSTHFSRSPLALDSKASTESGPSPLSAYSPSQLEALPERWFGIAMRAMRLGEWETVPRIRSIQTIILFTQYLQLSSSSRGQPSQLVVWLAGAIRLAQVLGLHLLGSNPETMPPEDPAFPPGRSSVKREMAKRLWAVLVYQDWLGANSRNRCYLISPLHFDTDDPLNLNDSDLSPSQTTSVSAPSTVLTDSTADRVRIATARQVRAVFDRVVLAHDSSVEAIVELDRGFRDILESLPESWTMAVDESEPPMVKFQRHFVLEGLHNRIFRLHRPLLSKASRNPKYKFSSEACLKSARAVVVSTHNIREAVLDVPYTFSHCLGASLVLFNDLFQAIDHDLSAPEIDSKIDTLQLALEIFSSKPTSPSLGAVVQQGQRILAGLFREEERRRTARAARALMLASTGGVEDTPNRDDEEETETFAEVLQRIARNLNTDSAPHRGTPPPTRNIPSKASAARFTSATFPPAAPSTLPPFDEQSVPTDSSNLPLEGGLSTGDPSTGYSERDPSTSTRYDGYSNDAQTWPFPRPPTAVDPLSLQFFHELDVGLPLTHLNFDLNPVSNMDGGGGSGGGASSAVSEAAAFWGAGSRAAEFASTMSGGGVGSGQGYGQSMTGDWNAQSDWTLDNLGLGGGW
ncbi:uncharacterized protein JCM6883_005771 [Sporobolomyces salmoneus]|uniref:uncharacterized protein n=1 Tax=Sporobolomyces salmoneus TaxID=183962 RepID=UPI00318107DC